MLEKPEIEKKAKEFGLSHEDIERDYIQSWIVKEIFADDLLAPRLTLKGSGALRKGYYPDTRFARDLDFSTYNHLDSGLLQDRLIRVGRSIETQTGITFVEEVRVDPKRVPEEMKIDALQARMYFKGIYSEGKFDLKTQVDLTQGEQLALPPQFKEVVHPYADKSLFSGISIRCQKLEEIIATKFITLIHRQRPGDLFDLVYSTFISNTNEINRGQVIRALLARTNFVNSLSEIRAYFLNLPLRVKYAQTWGGILIPVQTSLGFEEVERTFLSSIGTFFDDVATQAASFVRSIVRRKPNFSDVFRETIISAGRQLRLLKLTYHQKERLVEPYRLEYYTREQDGETNEYFWAFDRSGGNSQKISIKRLFCDEIQNVELTDQAFEPQWEVEL